MYAIYVHRVYNLISVTIDYYKDHTVTIKYWTEICLNSLDNVFIYVYVYSVGKFADLCMIAINSSAKFSLNNSPIELLNIYVVE